MVETKEVRGVPLKLGMVLLLAGMGLTLLLMSLDPKKTHNETLKVSCDGTGCMGKIVLKNRLLISPPPSAKWKKKENELVVTFESTRNASERISHSRVFNQAVRNDLPPSDERAQYVPIESVKSVKLADPYGYVIVRIELDQ